MRVEWFDASVGKSLRAGESLMRLLRTEASI